MYHELRNRGELTKKLDAKRFGLVFNEDTAFPLTIFFEIFDNRLLLLCDFTVKGDVVCG